MRRRWLVACWPVIALAAAGAQRAPSGLFPRDWSRSSPVRTRTGCGDVFIASLGLAPCAGPMGAYRPHAPNPPGARRSPASAWSIAASALLPGAGQAMLRVDRFVPYATFETYSWAQYAAHAGESRRERDNYRTLAARVARSAFTIVFPAGNFDYYERMEHFVESGVLEVEPGGVLDPEPDTTTYNGSVWLLARRTYWRDINAIPDTSSREWKLAADFYLRRAYDQSYRWSWRNAQLEYDEYRRLIRRSNDSNRKSLQDLGAILANHVLSTVDAYITVRLRRRPPPATGGMEMSASLPLSRLFAR